MRVDIVRDDCVQSTRFGVSFELPIPRLGIKVCKPLSEFREFVRIECRNLVLQFLDLCHALEYSRRLVVRLTAARRACGRRTSAASMPQGTDAADWADEGREGDAGRPGAARSQIPLNSAACSYGSGGRTLVRGRSEGVVQPPDSSLSDSCRVGGLRRDGADTLT